MKNRASSYTDYYKNNNRTPGGSLDDEEDRPTFSFSFSPRGGKRDTEMNPEKEDKRKAAIRRRLAKRARK